MSSIALLAGQIRMLANRVHEFATLDVPHRIAAELLRLSRPDPKQAGRAIVSPPPIHAEVAAPDFHARFSATGRHYFYRILCRRAPPVLEKHRVWHVMRDLDPEAMHTGAQALVGRHDFTTFRSSECQAKSPVKTLDRLEVRRAGDEIHVEASARSFLHHQVRSMVGSLKLVGEGKWRPRGMAKALDAKDRAQCGPVAPPEGLYLVRVDY